MRHIVLALAALACALDSTVAAQQGASVRPEQVVRVQAPAAGLRRPTIATVLEARRDTLFIQTAEPDTIRGGTILGQHAVPLRDVWRLEVASGSRSRTRGALLGSAIGTGTGVVLAALHMKFSIRRTEPVACEPVSPEDCWPPQHRLEPYPREKFLGITAAGTLIGTAAGAVFSGRRWRHVYPVTPAAGTAPGGGMQVGGTLRF